MTFKKEQIAIKTQQTMEATTGLVIKGLRERYGYTQEKLASFLEIKREMVSFYENNEREVPLEVLEKLSDLFGVEQPYFLVRQ